MSAPSREQQERDARHYLQALYADMPAGTVAAIGAGTRPHFLTRPLEAIDYVVGQPDVFARISVLGGRPDRGRGKADDTAALLCAWLDVDVDDERLAVELCHAVLAPTMLVRSGTPGHVQGYWMLEAPLIFASDEARARGRALAEGWVRRMEREAVALGIARLDHVGDLARVLRVPGSVNAKDGRVRPVVLLDDGGPRYPIAELEAECDPAPARLLHNEKETGRGADDLLGRYPRLGKIARRELEHAPGDGSPSAWDFHLACEAIRRVKGPAVADVELGALLRRARGLNPDENRKGERDDYIERTVAAARARESGPSTGSDAAKLISWCSAQWNLGADDPIVAWEAIGYGAAAIVRLTRRSGEVMRFGRIGDLYDPAKHVLQVSIAGHCDCPVLDKPRATRIAQMLGRACGVRADPRDEPVELEDRLGDFIAHLGRVMVGDVDDWATLVAVVDFAPVEKVGEKFDGTPVMQPVRSPSPAQRACAVRDFAGRLWLPAGPLADDLVSHGIKVGAGALRPRMEEVGWQWLQVDRREPKDSRGADVTFSEARHLIRVFYGEPIAPPHPGHPGPNARALPFADTDTETDDRRASRAQGLDGLDGLSGGSSLGERLRAARRPT